MNNFVGMDPAEVRRIGRMLEAQSRRLAEVAHTVDLLVRRAVADWSGQSAHQFARAWTSTLRPTITSAQSSMHGMAQVALQNADEQERASGASKVAPYRMGTTAGMQGKNAPSVAEAVDESIEELRGDLLRAHPEWSNLSPSDLIHTAISTGELVGLSDKLGSLSAVVKGADYYSMIRDAMSGEPGWQLQWIQEAGAAAAHSKNPVVALGGLSVALWSEVGIQAQKVDWSSETFSSTVDYAKSNPGVVLEEVGKATIYVATKVFGFLGIK